MSPPTINPFFNRHRITDRPASLRQRELERFYSAIATHQCISLVGERKRARVRSHALEPRPRCNPFGLIQRCICSSISIWKGWPRRGADSG
jgi:hypothetical protein